MSGFEADWLALREPADARARSVRLAAALDAHLGRSADVLEVVDLGGGTGANLRWLAPAIARRQHWRVTDNDAALLDALPARLHDWAADRGLRFEAKPAASAGEARLSVRGPTLPGIAVERVETDLSRDLDRLDLSATGLVTASALLDLVSPDWLAALCARTAAAGSAALFALSYDGRIELDPPAPDDPRLRDLVNRHQRGDKGFGAALGPAATDAAAAAFATSGYRIYRAFSDWRLASGADGALSHALIAGWVAAAREVEPSAGRWLDAWLESRRRAIDTGSLGIVVGHEDLLALPIG